MAKIRIWQHRCFKYTDWPHSTTCFFRIGQHDNATCWLSATLKKSHYRVNYDRRMFRWYPKTVCMIDYHFKHEGDLLAFMIKFPPSARLGVQHDL